MTSSEMTPTPELHASRIVAEEPREDTLLLPTATATPVKQYDSNGNNNNNNGNGNNGHDNAYCNHHNHHNHHTSPPVVKALSPWKRNPPPPTPVWSLTYWRRRPKLLLWISLALVAAITVFSLSAAHLLSFPNIINNDNADTWGSGHHRRRRHRGRGRHNRDEDNNRDDTTDVDNNDNPTTVDDNSVVPVVVRVILAEDAVKLIPGSESGAVTLANVTLAQLAAVMMPAWYQLTWSYMNDVLTPTVEPAAVFALRKTALKTRDLLDFFSPVYPTRPLLQPVVPQTPVPVVVVDLDDDNITTTNNDTTEIDDTETDETTDNSRTTTTTNRRGRGGGRRGGRRNMRASKTTDRTSSSSGNNNNYNDDDYQNDNQEEEQEFEEDPHFDLWYTIRKFLDVGYETLGHLQDLDHAGVHYTEEEVEFYRQPVLEWQEALRALDLKYDITAFLRDAPGTTTRCMRHDYESRLFWKRNWYKQRSVIGHCGDTPARVMLGTMAARQVRKAGRYLHRALAYESVLPPPAPATPEDNVDVLYVNDTVLDDNVSSYNSSYNDDEYDDSDLVDEDDNTNEDDDETNNDLSDLPDTTEDSTMPVNEAHEIYHDLRKELRSLLDEWDLFGSVLIVSDRHTRAALDQLKTARSLLGKLNDDYTAYEKYTSRNEYPEEIIRIAALIRQEWKDFRIWVNTSHFEETLQFLETVLTTQNDPDPEDDGGDDNDSDTDNAGGTE